MIPRVTKGSSALGALRYDFGPGRREEHENPRTVAGNLPGTWRQQGRVLDSHAARRPDVEKPVWRTSLRAAPQDRGLSDEEWRQVADRFVDRMGFQDTPWTATRHGEDHIHLTVSRVGWNGRVVDTSHDFARAQAACRVVEREHGLVDASSRYNRARPQVSHGERERSQRTGEDAERLQLRDHLDEATKRSGGTLEGYERALTEAGVSFRRNEASTGRVSGYSYGLAGHQDGAGDQVFYKGSQLGKDYRWAETQRRLAGREQDQLQTPTPSAADLVMQRIRGAQEAIQTAERTPAVTEHDQRHDKQAGQDRDSVRSADGLADRGSDVDDVMTRLRAREANQQQRRHQQEREL